MPNEYGGRENLEAIEFLRNTNRVLGEQTPGRSTMAEESTDFAGVSRPSSTGGLGFWFKWNLGWMHDTLDYMLDPVHRRHHHDKMTFGMLYNYTETSSCRCRMMKWSTAKNRFLTACPAMRQKFANLRAYYGWMFAFPGKKLCCLWAMNLPGTEECSLDWHLLEGTKLASRRPQRRARSGTIPIVIIRPHELDFDPYGFGGWLSMITNSRYLSLSVLR